ncbi:MAG: 2-hydroxy-3-oxopropionate reductase [Candidatus Oleimicrobiaceae bacterium]
MKQRMSSPRIGFIGLGIMGKPMATNLVRAGFEVTVYNRSKPAVELLVSRGAAAAPSPRAVAERSDVVITMVTDSPDVEQVILGPGGVCEGVRPGMVVIDMSTISPTVTKAIAAALKERGVAMLDAPVSGGDTGARAGTLAIMVGGDKEVFERCLPIFQAMGKSIVHVGANGMGQMTKLCNQVLVAVNNLATCEALLLASKAGLDPQVMIDAVKNGAAGSWQLVNLGPKMIARDFVPGFMVRLQQKDLRLALEVARELHLPLPALSLVHQLFASCLASGEGEEGTQALIKSLERLAQHQVGCEGK